MATRQRLLRTADAIGLKASPKILNSSAFLRVQPSRLLFPSGLNQQSVRLKANSGPLRLVGGLKSDSPCLQALLVRMYTASSQDVDANDVTPRQFDTPVDDISQVTSNNPTKPAEQVKDDTANNCEQDLRCDLCNLSFGKNTHYHRSHLNGKRHAKALKSAPLCPSENEQDEKHTFRFRRKFECTVCNQSFKTKDELESHKADSPTHARMVALNIREDGGAEANVEVTASDADAASVGTAADRDSIDEFFGQFLPGFVHDRKQKRHNEFLRLTEYISASKKVEGNSKTYFKNLRRKFRIAQAEAFGSAYGRKADNMAAWTRLCNAVGISPVPNTIEECQQAVLALHINLADMDDLRRSGKAKLGALPHRFNSLDDLRFYTLTTRRCFPKELAYSGELLEWLLREISGKYHGDRKLKEKI